MTATRAPKPTVIHDGKVFKLRSHKTAIPDLDSMEKTAVLVWLLRNTYPKGTNHRRPTPNLSGIKLEAR